MNDLLSSRAHSQRVIQQYCFNQQTQLNNMIHISRFFSRRCGQFRRINAYRFGGLSANFLQPTQEKNTEIISLSGEEIQQLTSISHYQASIQHLRQNKLQESYTQLQFALSEAKNKYPWSINLQACLMNRMSILVKLMNRKDKFQNLLQELYLISLSSKGPKSLDTIKNLTNYLICLTIFNPKKCNAVLDFISKDGLPDYVLFFDALNTIREKHQFKEGLQKLQKLPQEFPYEKIFKYNNTSFMKIYSLRQQTKSQSQYLKVLKVQSKDILNGFLKALLQAESSHQSTIEYTKQEIQASEKLLAEINLFLKGEIKELPTNKLSPKRILRHSNSHLISMNIASLLFNLKRLDQCFQFLQLTIEKAIIDNQLERVGIALSLLGRCYYLQGEQKWQQTFLDILQHSSTYPKAVTKEALTAYSRLLFEQGRYYQAENYLNQALTIEAEDGIEGLILPSYDFTF